MLFDHSKNLDNKEMLQIKSSPENRVYWKYLLLENSVYSIRSKFLRGWPATRETRPSLEKNVLII